MPRHLASPRTLPSTSTSHNRHPSTASLQRISRRPPPQWGFRAKFVMPYGIAHLKQEKNRKAELISCYISGRPMASCSEPHPLGPSCWWSESVEAQDGGDFAVNLRSLRQLSVAVSCACALLARACSCSQAGHPPWLFVASVSEDGRSRRVELGVAAR